MVSDLIRDSPFGQILRHLSGKRLCRYPEEIDPSVWTRYLDAQKSANVAHHGKTEKPEEGEEPSVGADAPVDEAQQNLPSPGSRTPNSRSSSQTKVGDDVNAASGVKVDQEKGKDLLVISWYDENDPENPQNWSLTKKCFVTGLICLLTLSVYIGSAIYTAGLMDVMQIFGVSQVAATLGLCLFVAGYGIGPMLWSPMSEIPQVGRNPVYIGTLFVFVVLQIPTALATNFGMLLAFRFLTGFFGSPILATGGASIGDIFSPKKRAYAMSVWGLFAICGPTLGPVVSGFAVEFAPVGFAGFTAPWTWPIWELCWLSALCFVLLFFFFPETSANNLLVRRAKRLRQITGDDRIISEPELMSQEMTGKDIVMMSLVKPFTLNFTEPMVFLLNLYIALVYGLLYIWFESFPIVFIQIYGFTLGTQGLAFLGILVGAVITIPPFFLYLYYKLEPQFDEDGNIAPEKRLYTACVGAFFVPICLFWFGWSAGNTHWIMPIIGSAFFSIGAFLLFNSILNYLPDAYPAEAASVLAGNDFMRSSFGAGFPLFASAMYKNLGVGWASSTLAFISIAFIPIPFVLVKYGETLRKNHSKAARKDI